VTKRKSGIAGDIKRGKKEAVIEMEVLTRLETALLAGRLASTVEVREEEMPYVHGLHLLTTKKILYVLNKKSGGKNLDEMNDPRFDALLKFMKDTGSKYVIVDAKIEEDLKEMVGDERDMFRKELGGTKDDGINDLIKAGYDMLGLMTYFTTGVEETRAWTIKKGWTAPLAGTAIHTDFKDKFIRAEVVAYDKLLEAGSYAVAREKGWVRTEGKEYIVEDGDVMEFRI
jgi:ribosome-binding ATPase YchF (GTP1/OBG family)